MTGAFLRQMLEAQVSKETVYWFSFSCLALAVIILVLDFLGRAWKIYRADARRKKAEQEKLDAAMRWIKGREQ